MTERVVTVKLVGESEQLKAALKSVDAEFEKTARQVSTFQTQLGKMKGGTSRYVQAGNRINKTNKMMRSSFQNASYQVQDIAVQMEMGIDPLRIFAQQGSQLLAGFGLWASVLSAAAVAVVAIGKEMGWFGETVEKTEKLIEKHSEAMSTLEEQYEILSDTALEETFGSQADAIREATGAMHALSLVVENAGFVDMLEGFNREFDATKWQKFKAAITPGTVGLITGNTYEDLVSASSLKNFEEYGYSMGLNTYKGYLDAMNHAADSGDTAGVTDLYNQFIDSATNGRDLEVIRAMSDEARELLINLGKAVVARAENIALLSGEADEMTDINKAQEDAATTIEKLNQDWIDGQRKIEENYNKILGVQGDSEAMLEEQVRLAREEAAAKIEATDAWQNQNDLTDEQVIALHEARDAAMLQAEETVRSADALEDAKVRAKDLAAALREAAAAMSAMTQFSQGLDKTLAQAEAKVEAIRSGANAANASTIAGMRVDAARLRDDALAAGGEPTGINALFAADTAKIDKIEKALKTAAELTAAQNASRGGGGGSKTEKEDPLEKLRREYELKMQLAGLDDARLLVLKKLGQDAEKYTETQIQGVVDLIEATEAREEQLKQMQDLETSINDNFEDAFASILDGSKSAKEAFSDFAQSVLSDLTRMIAKQVIFSTLGVGGSTPLAGIFGNAQGNAFQGGNVIPFAKGGVVGGPTAFPMSGGRTGLMGEAGAEAVMPLQRTSSGDLGVAGPSIQINNYTGQEVSVDRSEDVIRIAVGRATNAVRNEFARSLTSGQGTFARSIEAGTSARRKAT